MNPRQILDTVTKLAEEVAALVEERDELIASAAQPDAFCLARTHTHPNRVDEAVCSLRFQRDFLRTVVNEGVSVKPMKHECHECHRSVSPLAMVCERCLSGLRSPKNVIETLTAEAEANPVSHFYDGVRHALGAIKGAGARSSRPWEPRLPGECPLCRGPEHDGDCR